MWKTLFPLLESINSKSQTAGTATDVQPSTIMVHHSRNTAAKQWDETKALALSGVARVFSAQHQMTAQTADFPKAWEYLLGLIQRNGFDASAEVALAAAATFSVRCSRCLDSVSFHRVFQELLKSDIGAAINGNTDRRGLLWSLAWASWLRIAKHVVGQMDTNQKVMAALLETFISMHRSAIHSRVQLAIIPRL